MPNYRSRQIAKAIAHTNPKAAQDYLDAADLREKIDYEAKKAREGDK